MSSSSSSDSPGRSIRLVRSQQQRYVAGVIDGFAMTIEVVSANLMETAIFRFLEYTDGNGELAGDFDGICSPADLEEYPVDAAAADQIPAYFRSTEVELVFRSRTEADEAWTAIQAEVEALVNSLNLMDEQEQSDDVIFGEG